jgi:hypothetical protein
VPGFEPYAARIIVCSSQADHRFRNSHNSGSPIVTGAFGEAHNHNIPSPDTDRTILTYLEQGIFYVMIQTNVPEPPAKLKSLINRPHFLDVLFANGSFNAPGGHPSALVRRNIANGGMTPEDLDGGFIHLVRSREDIDRVWSTRIRKQQPDFIKLTLVYSEDRVAGVPRPDNDRHGLDPSLTSYLVGKAHADGLRVSAHVESAYDFDVAGLAMRTFAANFLTPIARITLPSAIWIGTPSSMAARRNSRANFWSRRSCASPSFQSLLRRAMSLSLQVTANNPERGRDDER